MIGGFTANIPVADSPLTDPLAIAGAVVALIVGLFGAGAAKDALKGLRAWRAGISANQKVAREQERVYRREGVELTLESLESRLHDVEARLDETERRNAELWNHVGVLETHIIEGKGPPPPRRPVFDDRWLTTPRAAQG